MPLSDFDHLLRDLATGFGTTATVLRKGANALVHTIEGRFLIDPFDVAQSPDPSGLNVTQTWFYYDQRHEYEPPLVPGVAAPALHDLLVIRGQEYEVIKIDKDDLGEHALQLLKVSG
jgi:hypothetical protein